MGAWRARTATVLFCILTIASAHGGDEMDMGIGPGNSHNAIGAVSNTTADRNYDLYDTPSYAGLGVHTGSMLTHIILMVLAWFFVLPIAVMFSIARSRLALPVQILFLTLSDLGVIAGTVYNTNTPDLYANNAHHKIGWIATWIVTAQVLMSMLSWYSRRTKQEVTTSDERAAFLPVSLHGMNRPIHKHRWSGDSGQGTESPSSSMSARSSRTLSPDRDYDYSKVEQDDANTADVENRYIQPPSTRRSWFKNMRMPGFATTSLPQTTFRKATRTAELAYNVVDRAVLVLGFVAFLTGIATYTGLFRANNIFGGMAHWVKGGIFFWYGLLTLGRWLGSFADFGWAWNLKPTRSEVGWKVGVPTAEFTESFVIFLYGCTNVFMEHLGAAGGPWAPQDLEHVSISVMFFGGGLAGMLVESKTLRTWLNSSIDQMPVRTEGPAAEADAIREEPRTYTTSLNIMPALVILLLGIMMSGHHQDSMLSTMVHKQWGTLLTGFSVCRGLTYVLNYLSPPKSIYPSRPPTELAASFCLISGGIVFMLSVKDVIHYMDEANLMAMFVFTVVVGFTAFLMAYTMVVVGLKGWVMRREEKRAARAAF